MLMSAKQKLPEIFKKVSKPAKDHSTWCHVDNTCQIEFGQV